MQHPPGRLDAPFRSAVFLGWLGIAAFWDAAQRRAARETSPSALSSMVDRLRFGPEARATDSKIHLDSDTVRDLVRGEEADVLGEVYRKGPRLAIQGHFDVWRQESRRGLVVVTGDRGDGKHSLLRRMADHLTLDERAPTVETLDRRLGSEEDVLAFLLDWLGLEGVPLEREAVVAAIAELPPRVHVLHQIERTFLRRVHGFDAIRTLLYVSHATGERHFWILTVHRPSWAYLSRLGRLVNVAVARGVVDLAPLTGPQTRELVMARTEAVGLDVDFHRLLNTGPFGAPPDIERERAVAGFFRLLAEGSGGCPLVAMHLWSRSLRPREDGRSDVVVVPELAGAVDLKLVDRDLFVLAALRIQDRMTLAELCEVINQGDGDVVATVRSLVGQGILHQGDKGLRIDTLHVKAVTRVLRRRHFLQYEV